MRANVIHNLPEWQVTSYGNGLAYELANKSDRLAVFFQGDDAGRFRDELDSLTCPSAKRACLSYSDALGMIWDDYADNAQPWEQVA